MNANFEESLNLQDDKLVKYMINDVEKPGVKEKPILLKFLAILFISLLYGLCILIKYFIKNPDPSSPVPIPKVNLLPTYVFWIFLFVFLCVWTMTLIKRNKSTKFFFSYINTTNYVLWLVIEVNLFFLTFLLSSLTFYGVLTLLIFLGLTGYIIFRSKSKSLEKQLFNTAYMSNKIDRIIQKMFKVLFKYGWIFVLVLILWKFIFPNINGSQTDSVGFVGIITMWIVFDIVYIILEAYLFFPYLLYGYYRYKYPEEYRDWEGHTQLEWYGKKYFNKHIKGTKKEEKIND